jgi:hypothetical protein
MPIFYQNVSHTVAVQGADGISNIPRRLEETLATPGITEPDGIGLVLDSDSTEAPAKRAGDLAAESARNAPHLPGPFPSIPGAVQQPSAPARGRRGVFVLPDNANPGTLEDLLLECGQTSYPQLLALATNHVAVAQAALVPGGPTWTKDDHAEFSTPAGVKKAKIASAAAILKPGRTSQVSVSDNRWVEPATLALPKVKALADWLEQLSI